MFPSPNGFSLGITVTKRVFLGFRRHETVFAAEMKSCEDTFLKVNDIRGELNFCPLGDKL